MATVVTGLFDIGRGNWTSFNRPFEDYLGYFSNVLRLAAPMVVFCESSTVALVESIRQPMAFDTKIVATTLEDLYMHRYKDLLYQIQRDPNYAKGHPAPQSPEIKEPMYSLVVNSKLDLVYQASKLVASDYLIWIDGGYTHSTVDISKVNWDPSSITAVRDRISIINLTPLIYNVPSSCRTFSNMYQDVVDGGFFGGSRTTIEIIHQKYYDLVEESLKFHRVKDDDQYHWAMLIQRHPQLFNLIPGQWYGGIHLDHYPPLQLRSTPSKRVALCLRGDIKHWSQTYSGFKTHCWDYLRSNDYQVDIFVSFKEDTPIDLFRQIKTALQPRSVFIEPDITSYLQLNYPSIPVAELYDWYLIYSLYLQVERVSDCSYDLIINSSVDTIWDTPLPRLDSQTLYLGSDRSAIGPYSAMVEYMKTYVELIKPGGSSTDKLIPKAQELTVQPLTIGSNLTTKPKVAILLCGHLRTWEICRDSFLDYFQDVDYDIFVDTYYTLNNYHPHIQNKYQAFDESHIGTVEEVKKVLDVPFVYLTTESDQNIFLPHYLSTGEGFQYNQHPPDHDLQVIRGKGIARRTYFQFRKFIHCNRLRHQHQQETGTRYDYVIKTRPDLDYSTVTTPLTEILKLVRSKLLITTPHPVEPCDHIYVGLPVDIDALIASMEAIKMGSDKEYNPHEFVEKGMKESGLSYQPQIDNLFRRVK